MAEEQSRAESHDEGSENSVCDGTSPDGGDSALGRALIRVMRAVMFDETPHPDLDSLPLAQLRLLWTVFYQADATMKDFSEKLGVSQSTVTQLADRLVRRGLVDRRTDSSDRRVVRLHVSQLGLRILGEANSRQRHTFEDVWRRIVPEHRSAVIDGLDILGAAAEQMRAQQGNQVYPWLERARTDDMNGDQATETSQPLVDLMARRVRGRTAR